MRVFISILGFLLSLTIVAQNPQHRRVLKNTLNAQQLQSRTKNLVYSYGFKYSNCHINHNNFKQHRGTSEVFVRIPNLAYYTIELNGEIISSPYGMFRFFDISSGHQNISIYHDGYLVYRTHLDLENHSRTILEFSEQEGLFLLDVVHLHNTHNHIQNNDYQSYILRKPYVMSPREFAQFKKEFVKNNAFDEDKMKFLVIQLSMGKFFTTKQIKKIVRQFFFDERKLEALEKMFDNCVDIENYYLLENEFSFSSTKEAFIQMLERKFRR